MLYTGDVCLAGDLNYIYVYCTYQHKINHYPGALQSVTANFCTVTADFYMYRLFNRSSRMAAPEVAHLELSGHRPARSTLNY